MSNMNVQLVKCNNIDNCPSQIFVRIDFVEVFDIGLESRGGFIIDMNRKKQHEI